MRIPLAENPRFPGEGKSSQGEAGPKARPKGVVDGQQVNIPAPSQRSNRSADLLGQRDCQMSRCYADAGGGGSQKSSGGKARPVPKLTQVRGVNNLRRSRERS